jgi:hypothetical protein
MVSPLAISLARLKEPSSEEFYKEEYADGYAS